MIRGLLHGIKRFWSRRVLTRRPSCHRKRGGFMGRAGIDLFIEDGAYTTLSSAVVILSGAHVVVFVDRGDMEHVARGGHPGGGR